MARPLITYTCGTAPHVHPILHLLFCTALLLALLSTARSVAAEPVPSSEARLDRATVVARGKQSALLTVNAFGRYAVTVSSAQGVALQAVDRMAGSGPLNGQVGKQDGRLDLFLDRGEYKILTHAASKGKGQVKLAAHSFVELQAHAPQLVEHRLERATLGDFEQRSYWIEIKEKRFVAIEAAGRHLADLRLWRDGTWLVETTPQLVQSQARPAQPLQIARLTAELTPGLYLLTAYGGPSQVWTEASAQKPFFLRMGIPTLAPAMRQQFSISEFGVDRFLVPAGPNYFRLELPVAKSASLQVGDYTEANPFQVSGQSASIDKRSVPPVAELPEVHGGEVKLVTVSGEAGQPLVLQHFEATRYRTVEGAGPYWISSIHAGTAEDNAGVSAILTRTPRYGREEYLDEQVIEIGGSAQWHRRFNLLGEVTLFVKVSKLSKVRVAGTGAKAQYRFQPFLISHAADYKAPPWRDSGAEFELDRGLHVLSIAPTTKGILDLHVADVGTLPTEAITPVMATARFPSATLDGSSRYGIYLNSQADVASGIVVRSLPIDLRTRLPVAQRGGEGLTIPVQVPERGVLQALAEDGRALNITLENGASGTALELNAGRYNVVIPASAQAQYFSLGLEPTRLASSTPLPPLPDARLAGLPKFPVMVADRPHYVDLDRNSSVVHNVRVDTPGLYRFESSGLLATSGTVRTRINPSLFDDGGNGVGRNFLIQRYLREGDYQLSVTTLGETTGHLGVQLLRNDIVDGGTLREGQVARAMLPVGQAIAYRFSIAHRGSYHLQTLGLGRLFDVRLEDDAGWPLAAPVQSGDLTWQFEPGNYRVLVLPQTAEARVLARLDRVAEPVRYSGHGPHRIALEAAIEHTWREPAKGAIRVPDQWEFALPAGADISIALDGEMEAVLTHAGDAKNTVVAKVSTGQNWRGPLAMGRYLLRATNSRSNSHVPYTLRVAATQLLAGQARSVTAPASIPVSVGADGLLELASFGATDVRASLFDNAGELIAQNDDRTDDWNFQIARRLSPGSYRLQIDPVNGKQAQTTVSMQAPAEVAEQPLVMGTSVDIKDANVHIYPLVVPQDRNLLLISAASTDVVGVALEGDSANGWVNLGSVLKRTPYLALPLPSEPARYRAYRMRAWSVDRRSLQVRVRAAAVALTAVPESQWLRGVVPAIVDDALPTLRATMVALERPGVFRMAGELSQLQWSDSGSRVTQGQRTAVASVSGKTLWLLSDDPRPRAVGALAPGVLAAERLRLPTGEQQDPLRLELRPQQAGSIDVQPSKGPSLLIAKSGIGQPGIGVGSMSAMQSMGLTMNEAVAVVLPGVNGANGASVWNAGNQDASFEVDVRQVPMEPIGTRPLAVGLLDGTLAPRAALTMGLPAGGKSLRLTLAPMSAAVLVARGEVQSTYWGGERALHEVVSTDADQLWLLNADGHTANYSVEVAPGTAATEPALKPGDLLERNLSAAGRVRIPVDIPIDKTRAASKVPAEPYTIRVRGPAQALWLENSGRVVSGTDIVARDSGVLMLQHQPGTLIAWLDAPKAQAAKGVMAWFKSTQETSVKPPQAVALKGKQQVLTLDLAKAAMVHLRTTVPVVTQFVVDGQAPQTQAHLFGANINLLVPAGLSRLVLRAVGADSLSGVASLLTTSITQLGEGVGPEVLLAPGSARLYAFDLAQARAIGIGVRAQSDVVRSVLFDQFGAALSEGVVQMPTLAPGRYYLAIDLPLSSAPVRAQPILLGLNAPDTRPPRDILRRYLEAVDGDPLLYVPVPPTPAVNDAEPEEMSDTAPSENESPEAVGEDMPESDKDTQ